MSVLAAFAAAVADFHDLPAVCVNQATMSYAELDSYSDEIADLLRHAVANREPGFAVGLLVARTRHLIPSLIGILKAGAAYIPIDPWLPDDRITAMLTDGGARAVVSDGTFDCSAWADPRRVPVVEPKSVRATEPTEADPPMPQPGDPAYVIFTSGSTGRPKGVVVSHGNLAAFCSGWSRAIPFRGARRMAAVATIGFDIFLAETLVPLLNGVEVVLAAEGDVASPQAFVDFLRRESCDMLQATPSRIRWVLSTGEPQVTLQSTRVLVVGGERLPDDLVATLFQHSRARLFNAYGPTEATVWTSAAELRPGDPVTIGAPIPGVAYQVERTTSTDSTEGDGELLILGDAVARYLSRLPDGRDGFFLTDDGVSGFRTGDRVIGDDPDKLTVLGRLDDQVKIDGYRVELGEIEAVARAAEGVETAHACLIGRDQHRTLALIFEGSSGVADVESWMAQRLPRYMMPTAVFSGRVTLSSAGKTSRRTVEALAVSRLQAARDSRTLQDMVDEFTKRFAGSIPVPGTGVLGSLGLGSLACVRLLAQLEITFGRDIELGELLCAQSMSELEALVLEDVS